MGRLDPCNLSDDLVRDGVNEVDLGPRRRCSVGSELWP